MKYLAQLAASFIVTVGWIAGMVLAQGFWSTSFAIFIPPYAFYLVIERLIHTFLP